MMGQEINLRKVKISTLAGGMVNGYTAREARKKRIDLFKEITKHNTKPALLEKNSGIIAKHNISVIDLTAILIKNNKKV